MQYLMSCYQRILTKKRLITRLITLVCMVFFLSLVHIDLNFNVSLVKKSQATDFGLIGLLGPQDEDDEEDDEKDDNDDDEKDDGGGGGGCGGSNGGAISVIGGSGSGPFSRNPRVVIIHDSNNGKEGGPVSLVTGAELFNRTDITINGVYPIRLKRKYSSHSTYQSNLGYGWSFTYDQRLYEYADQSVVIRYGCGKKDRFVFTANQYQSPVGGISGELSALPVGGHVFVHSNGYKDVYDIQGRLTEKTDLQGNSLKFTYDARGKLPLTGSSPYAVDPFNPMLVAYKYRLVKVEEMLSDGSLTGNALVFSYDDPTGRLMSATANDGRVITYTHDTTLGLTIGNLTHVVGLDNFESDYKYEDPIDPHNITTIQEGVNAIKYFNAYDIEDKVVSQTHGNTIRNFDYIFTELKTEVTTIITDENNQNPQISKVTYDFDLETQKVIRFEDAMGNWFEYDFDALEHTDKIRIYENTGTKQNPDRVLIRTADLDFDTSGNKIKKRVVLDSGEIITKTWTYDNGRMSSQEVVSSLYPEKRFRTEYTFYRDSNGIPTNIFEEKRLKDDGLSYQTITYTYDALNRKKTVQYPDGHIQEYAYESLDHPYVTKIFHRVAGVETNYLKQRFAYDVKGRISDSWDGNNYLTHTEYDDLGRATLIRNALNEEAHLTYSDDRKIQNEIGRTIADGEGQVLKYNYNSNHRLANVQRKTDSGTWLTIESYTYYSDKSLHTKTDGENNTWTYSYDGNRRLKTIIDPKSNITLYKYDAVGNRVSVIDANLNETKYVYDDLERLIKTEQLGVSPGIVTKYGYDANDNLVSVTDAKNNVTLYTYDTLSRKTSEIKPLLQTLQYFYDDRNRIDYTLNARGQKIDYSYEAWGGLDLIRFYQNNTTPTIDRTIDYNYDFNGNVTSISDTDISATPIYTMTYDQLNRPDLTTVHYIPGGNITLKDGYDRYGNRNSLILTDATGIASHQYNYNKLNRLNTAILPNSQNIGFDYYNNNQLKQLQFGNNLNTNYQYETNGPVSNISLTNNAAIIEQLSYTYDKVNNVDTLTGTQGLHDFGYDNLYRLTQALHPAGLGVTTPEDYSYDSVGNREAPADNTLYEYDNNNRITKSPGVTDYTFDDDGNMTTNASGELFAYNHLNRILAYVKSGSITSYKYDPQAKRVNKNVNGTQTWYLWDDDKLLAEYNNTGQRQKRYAYLPGKYAPTQVEDSKGSYTSFSDHLDTPKLLINSGNTIVWRADYESFGNTDIKDNPDGDGNSVEFNMRFPGQYYDAESNTHYNLNRTYNPSLGGYLESDPIGLDGGINTFTYVLNNPLKYNDPLGLCPLGGILCGTIGFGLLEGGIVLAGAWGLNNSMTDSSPSDLPAANDDRNPAVGDNNPTAPSSCAVWKAVTQSRKENAEMIYNMQQCPNPMVLANINRDIGAYNASCGNVTGKIAPLLPVID